MKTDVLITDVEQFFEEDELIVSKTDLKGKITYCNDVFLRIAGYTEDECLGQPHSMIRHPKMPRSVFKTMWETIESGNEIFAYVINRCKNGDHYWVQAHVTPSFDSAGQCVGYHSNRRVPDRRILESAIMPLYEKLLAEEHSHANKKEGMNSAYATLQKILEDSGKEYDEFVATL